MIEIMAVCLLGIALSLGVLLIAVSKEYPKRKSTNKKSSQAIRDRHLEMSRPIVQAVIEPTQIIV